MERFQKGTYFPEAYVSQGQLPIGVCGRVTIRPGKISYRSGQDLTATSVAAVESPREVQGSTVLEIGDSPDFALSLSLSGFLVTFEARGGAAQSTTRTPSTPYGTGKRECAPRDRGEGQHA